MYSFSTNAYIAIYTWDCVKVNLKLTTPRIAFLGLHDKVHSIMTTLIITIIAFFASILTLYSGFGLGTILMPVVAIFFPVAVAVALTAFVHLLNNLFKLAALWRDINWRITWRFGPPAILATVPGAWLLTDLSNLPELYSYSIAGIDAVIKPVKLTVGLLLIIFATVEWLPVMKKIKLTEKSLPFGGVLSGFFGGLSGHQGAFRSAFLIHAGLDKNAFALKMHSREGASLYNYWFSLEPKFFKMKKWSLLTIENTHLIS